jgi:hypothetical protein
MADGHQLVDNGPSFTPLRYGLLSAAQPIEDPDPHWQLGTIVLLDACGVPLTVTGGPCSAASIQKAPSVTGLAASAANPFSVYAWVNCAPVGQGDDLADLITRTDALLTNGEGRAVEHAVWTGQASNGPVNPRLAANAQSFITAQGAQAVELQSAATTVTGVPLAPLEALALLEGNLAACYGGEGVIHVPAAAVAYLANQGLVKAQGNQLRTTLGNIVAAYAPGDRHGPTGSEPGAGLAWFYATGAVTVRRSPIKGRGVMPGSFVGRTDNSTVYVAERTYVVDWDCCHFAAQVTMVGVP